MNIYVGNLSFDANENSLKTAFEAYGTVSTVRIVTDRDTGRSKGFGFVDMDDSSEAMKAISNLNETDLDGRTIRVNEAKPRTEYSGTRSSKRF